MIARGSVQARLVVQLILVASVMTILFMLAVRVIGERIAQSEQDRTLVAAASAINDSLSSEFGDFRVDLPYSAFAMLDASSQDSVFYRISSGGNTMTGYDELPVATGSDEANFYTQSFLGEDVRGVTLRRSLETEGVAKWIDVTLAQTRQGYLDSVIWVQTLASVVGIGFFLLATMLCVLTSRSVLRPLNSLVKDIQSRGAEDLTPVDREVPTEIAPLITALNSFMRRLGASLDKAEDFITEAAHRIRTPMALMQSQGEIALQLAETPKMRAVIREIIGASRETSRSASQLLDHATVAFRAENPQLETLSLTELVAHSAARFLPLADMKAIKLHLPDAQEHLEIHADRLLIESAIGNVIDNALKYSSPDTHVQVHYKRQGDMAEIHVRDEGPGFDPAVAKRATERFFRGEQARETEGSGLGLKIVHDALDVHNGRIKISANEGPGSCVSLLLPLH